MAVGKPLGMMRAGATLTFPMRIFSRDPVKFRTYSGDSLNTMESVRPTAGAGATRMTAAPLVSNSAFDPDVGVAGAPEEVEEVVEAEVVETPPVITSA